MILVATLGIGPLGSFLKPKQVCHNNKSCLECMWQRNFSLFLYFSHLFFVFNVQLLGSLMCYVTLPLLFSNVKVLNNSEKFAKHFDLGHLLHNEISNYGNFSMLPKTFWSLLDNKISNYGNFSRPSNRHFGHFWIIK